MSEAESTTVDVLIARLSTHPEEFFVAEAVITQDGARIFAGTKWRRITTMLMTPMNVEGNMWLEMFSDEEKARFKAAMMGALRGVIDTQMMKVLTGGDPVELDPEEKQRRQEIAMQQQIRAQHANYQQQALANQVNALGAMASQGGTFGTLTVGYGDTGAAERGYNFIASMRDEERKAYEEYVELRERQKAAKSHPPLSIRDKVKKYFP